MTSKSKAIVDNRLTDDRLHQIAQHTGFLLIGMGLCTTISLLIWGSGHTLGF